MAETNKTEKATPKKRRDERKKGNAFQSRDVVSVGMLLIGFIMISKLGVYIMIQMKTLFIFCMEKSSQLHELTISSCKQILCEAMLLFFLSVIPILLALAFAAFVMTGIQTKFLVSLDLLKFKRNRISIIEGFKRMFSLRSVVQLIKSLIKVAIILWIIYTGVQDLMTVTPDMLNTELSSNLDFMMNQVMAIVYKICIIFAGMAIVDFAYQKYEYEKKLMMTKQEIKDEHKQVEGDPFIKGKIKEKQRRMSLNRMIQQVPHADVVVRNPTHYAVALRYDIDKDMAPMVIAKGQNHMAKRIIDAAENSNVLIAENKPLARSLYEIVDVNEYIPAEMYQLVAELMAWVYGIKNKNKRVS